MNTSIFRFTGRVLCPILAATVLASATLDMSESPASAQTTTGDVSMCGGGVTSEVVIGCMNSSNFPTLCQGFGTNIQGAINFASTGLGNGSVSIPGGPFVVTSPLIVNAGITIRGNGASQSPTNASSKPTVIISQGTGSGAFQGGNLSGLTIQDLSIQAGTQGGLAFGNIANSTFQCLKIEGGGHAINLNAQGLHGSGNTIKKSHLTSANGHDVILHGNSNVVRQNTIFGKLGVLVEGNANMIDLNTFILDISEKAVTIHSGVGNQIGDNDVMGALSGLNGTGGINAESGSSDTLIVNNDLDDVATAIRASDGSTVAGNRINGCLFGISVRGTGSLVKINHVSACDEGINLFGVSGVDVVDNDISGSEIGIHVDASNDNWFFDNSISFSQWVGIKLDHDADGNTFTENSIDRTVEQAVWITQGSDNSVEYNILDCNSPVLHMPAVQIDNGTGNSVIENDIKHVGTPEIVAPSGNVTAPNIITPGPC